MILIDTNVYSASNIGNADAIAVMKQSSVICLPTVVIAELRAGFLNGNKNEINNKVLNDFLSDEKCQIVDITIDTTRTYAQLAYFAKARGRSLSNNDIWIAAIAKEKDLKLVTFDKDFEVFSNIFNNQLLILN